MNLTTVRLLAFVAVVVLPGLQPEARAQAGSIVGPCGPSCGVPEPNSGFVGVARGNYHAMGLRSDGTIEAWGECDVEQCDVPPPNTGFTAIAAGDSFSMGLRADGSIAVFGSNEYGQHEIPQPNSDYVAMAAGLIHALALRSDGSIVHWGFCFPGGCTVPEPNTDWVAVAAGAYYSMGLKADRTLRAWGCFPEGGLCDVPEPTTRFKAMAISFKHALAVREEDGSVLAWGDNEHGQLNVPEPNTGFVSVLANFDSSIGLKADGSIVCWGLTADAQCGMPPPNSDFVAVATDNWSPLAIRAQPCQANADCDDGLFCDGAEACVSGTCQPGAPPCVAPFLCRESDDRCVSCLGDAQCDDGLFCNGAESCAQDGTCRPGADPCPGLSCHEPTDTCTGGAEVWLSFTGSTSIPGVGTVAAQDIVARNAASGAWSMVFDGSDVGLTGQVIDGMARLADGSILLSLAAPATIPGMTGGPNGTALDDSDIVRFVPTSLGTATAGSFVFYFDGSDVGLTNDNEDVDAIALTPAGQLVISTLGKVSANGANGADTDLLLFNATGLGAGTAGSFSLHFDGSDVGLADNGAEDADAAAVMGGDLLLSTTGEVSVPGVTGANEDVLRFTPLTLGGTTSGTWAMHLDLSELGIPASADVGAVEWKP
jgi:alpha-tubulin suppressor-like RCC1 family protein